jgi:hypothetical protein
MCLFQFLVGPKTRKGRVVTSFSRSIVFVLLSIPPSFHALSGRPLASTKERLQMFKWDVLVQIKRE